MGYNPKRKIYKLVFEDEEMAGLEVRVRSFSIGTMLEVGELSDLMGRKITPEDMPRVQKLFSVLAQALVSWNVEDDDGAPVPATLEGLTAQEDTFVFAVLSAWIDAVSGVSAPLPQTSSDGQSSLEASIPMVPLSASQAS
jgi:hypothetical protein